jgi:CRP-like cAMP-binding protein
LLPWWEYFLGVVLLGAYREFERRTGEMTFAHGAKRQMIMDVIGRLPDEFRVADIEHACPGVSRPTINRALRDLREDGKIACIKGGRDAVWQKRGP